MDDSDTDRPGAVFAGLFAEYASAYRAWFLRDGIAARASLSACQSAIRQHLGSTARLYDMVCDTVSADDVDARLLSLYCPPPIVRACSQIVTEGPAGPVLIRSYDHAPHLCDTVFLWADWQGMRTLASTDITWAALDGMNESGLAVALSFGGCRTIGRGFGASLIVRHVLQTCETVRDVATAVRTVPIAMAYTLAVLDANGDASTIYLQPGKEAVVTAARASTNHQGRVEWPEYAAFVESERRLAHLDAMRGRPCEEIRRRFLEAPLWRRQYSKGSGTLYVSEYCPQARTMTVHWPGQHITKSLLDPEPDECVVDYSNG